MKPVWGDLNARVRGLGSRLLGREELLALSLLPDLPALATDLARRGFPLEEGTTSPAGIELGVRRKLAEQLRILGRWTGRRSETLSVLFDDEDRRSLRAILRRLGRAGFEPGASGWLPTPALPERALQELAHQPSIPKVAALLSAWRHPFGPPLAQAAGAEPDLLDCEVRINRAFAARALRGARRAGKQGVLMTHVRTIIDIENAYSTMALSGAEATSGERMPEAFLEGGRRVTRELFEAATSGQIAAGPAMARAFAGSTLAAAFATLHQGADVERAVLEAQIAEMRSTALRQPLGPAPVIHFALRVRGQLLDLQRITWGMALGAPRSDLATPAATP